MANKSNNVTILYWVIWVLSLLVVWMFWYLMWQDWKWWDYSSKMWSIDSEISMIAEAWRLGLDVEELRQCAKSNKYTDKINSQMRKWGELFGITWTPGNILINNETWEYEVIAWAYPKETFMSIIDRLLSEASEIPQNENVEKKDFVLSSDKNTLTVISDRRDGTTPLEEITWNLRQIENIWKMEIQNYDFSDNGVEEYLRENKIENLPAFIFSTNKIDDNIDSYLTKLEGDNYSLNVWASFSPFGELSSKWFKLLDKSVIEDIKKDSYIEWNENAKITWLEYSDLECPFCARLHNSDVESSLKEKYSSDLNIIFNHFPLWFHKKALPGAKILECVWEQGWVEAFYKVMRYSFKHEVQE